MLLDDGQAERFGRRRAARWPSRWAARPRLLGWSSVVPALAPVIGRDDTGTLQIGQAAVRWHRYALQPMPGEVAEAGASRGRRAALHRRSEATLRSVRLALAAIALLTAVVASVASYALARTITRPLAALATRCARWRSRGPRAAAGARADARLGRRGRAAAGGARSTRMTEAIGRFQQQAAAARAAVGARPAVDGDRPRDPQSADDRQRRPARPAPAGRPARWPRPPPTSTKQVAAPRPRGDRRARLRAARAARARAGRPPRRVPRGRRSRAWPPKRSRRSTLRLEEAADPVRHRRRAPARGAGQPAGQRAAKPCARPRRAAGAGRRHRRHAPCIATAVMIEVEDTARASSRTTCRRCSSHTSPPAATGTGLGLAIARNIVEGLGGTIVTQQPAGRGHHRAHHPARDEEAAST